MKGRTGSGRGLLCTRPLTQPFGPQGLSRALFHLPAAFSPMLIFSQVLPVAEPSLNEQVTMDRVPPQQEHPNEACLRLREPRFPAQNVNPQSTVHIRSGVEPGPMSQPWSVPVLVTVEAEFTLSSDTPGRGRSSPGHRTLGEVSSAGLWAAPSAHPRPGSEGGRRDCGWCVWMEPTLTLWFWGDA